MPRKKHIARVQRSYSSLITVIKTNQALDDPSYSLRHAAKVSSDDLEHLRDLVHLKNELYELKARFPIASNLQFTSSSAFIKANQYARADFASVQCANIGPSALSLRTDSNRRFLVFEQKIFRILHTLKELPTVAESLKIHHEFHNDLVAQTIKVLEQIDTINELKWNRQQSGSTGVANCHIFRNDYDISLQTYLKDPRNTLAHTCHILILMMHLFFGLAQRAVSVLVHGFFAIILASSGRAPTSLDGIATDLSTMFKRYRLDPVIHSYVCCPKCFALYEYDRPPDRCTFKEFEDSESCHAMLFKTRTIRAKEHRVPITTYLHQDLQEWISHLLSRPEIEDILEQPAPAMLTKYMQDIWHGTVFKTFLERYGFRSRKDGALRLLFGLGALRLLFGLGVDGFNSYRNLQAKKKATSTGIYMICFNLPPDIRYLPKNMYLAGVIPGKPSLDQINHSLGLLVSDLKPFWKPGVRYTRTAKWPCGRLVNAALIPLISDLIAGRQVGGFGGVGHTFFCTRCLTKLDDIENLDPSKWLPRTCAFHAKGVEEWKSARSHQERTDTFKKYAARWSVLSDLPYWNALDFTVIDSMHNHYLGLLQNHIRSIWGINIQAEDGDGLSDPRTKPPPVPDSASLQEGVILLQTGDKDELLKLQ